MFTCERWWCLRPLRGRSVAAQLMTTCAVRPGTGGTSTLRPPRWGWPPCSSALGTDLAQALRLAPARRIRGADLRVWEPGNAVPGTDANALQVCGHSCAGWSPQCVPWETVLAMCTVQGPDSTGPGRQQRRHLPRRKSEGHYDPGFAGKLCCLCAFVLEKRRDCCCRNGSI